MKYAINEKKKLATSLQSNFVIERTQHIDKSYQIHLGKINLTQNVKKPQTRIFI